MSKLEDIRNIKAMTVENDVQEVLSELNSFVCKYFGDNQIGNTWSRTFMCGGMLKEKDYMEWCGYTFNANVNITKLEDIEDNKIYKFSRTHNLIKIDIATMEEVKIILDKIEELVK